MPRDMQVVSELVDDVGIDKVEDRVAVVDQRDLGVQRAEDGGVFHADHAGADDGHRAGNGLDLQQAVAVDDGLVIEGDVVRPVRNGAGGDDDLVGAVVGALSGDAGDVHRIAV